MILSALVLTRTSVVLSFDLIPNFGWFRAGIWRHKSVYRWRRETLHDTGLC